MKIYRVVPRSFTTGRRINSTNLTGVEDIYYKMGFTSFIGKRNFHNYNNISDGIKEEGKYFFLFFDDALFEGSSLLWAFHNLRMDTCSIIEYDVPEDIILKHIGYGDYTTDITRRYILETHIEKKDLGSDLITTEDISKENKILTLTDVLIDDLKVIKELGFSSYEDNEFYCKYFNTSDFSELIKDKEKLTEGILKSPFYFNFMKESGELIKSPYITSRIIPLNMSFLSRKLSSYGKIEEYFQEMGIDCRTSKQHDEFKEEVVECVIGEKKDREKIKTLLREGKYI